MIAEEHEQEADDHEALTGPEQEGPLDHVNARFRDLTSVRTPATSCRIAPDSCAIRSSMLSSTMADPARRPIEHAPLLPRRRRCHRPVRMRSEEHTSELQSRGLISYAVFCLKKK